MKTIKSFGYFFLNRRLHPPTPKEFRTSIILLIINKNKTINRDKFLLVQQNNQFWNLPKEGIEKTTIIDDVYTTIARNLEEEIGFRGLKVSETKPLFKQVAFLFDFDQQIYDKERSLSEEKRSFPKKGKIYHLAIMDYSGPDEIPIDIKREGIEIINYKWVNLKQGKTLMESNKKLLQKGIINSPKTTTFNIYLFEKVLNIYSGIQNLSAKFKSGQNTLL